MVLATLACVPARGDIIPEGHHSLEDWGLIGGAQLAVLAGIVFVVVRRRAA